MKKLFSLCIASALCICLLAGCGSDGTDSSGSSVDTSGISESGEWTDGTYTETAEGRNGDFEVTVTVSGGVMTEISVGDNSETEDRGGVAISTLPDEMLDAQSWEVDAVSGATVTSEALMDAVASCLVQASQ